MAALEVIALDTSVPQLMAPQAGDTYTFPRAVEMPLNTANGVLYLNGSKVVTSGSALTFDGTNFAVGSASAVGGGRIGAIADLTAGNGLVLRDSATSYANNDNYILLQNSTGVTAGGLTHPAANSLGVWGNDDIRFLQSGAATELMRLTSTGLGIGTSSPGQKLSVSASASDVASFVSSDTNADIYLKASGTTLGNTRLRATGGDLVFITGLNDRMRLDSSGNLGLGVTPSAWNTSWKASEIGVAGNALVSAAVNNVGVTSNAVLTATGWKYGATGYANFMAAGNGGGQFAWYNAPSGTAGDAISFSQVMTLDASGNLLVGTTSSTARIESRSDANSVQRLLVLRNNHTTAGSAGSRLGFGTFRDIDANNLGAAIDCLNVAGNVNGNLAQGGSLVFSTAADGSSGLLERARIPAAGGMVVGTAALATTATDGFLYVPTCAGTPTGTPTTQTGTAPIVVDTTNNKLYFYSGGQWRDAGP